MFHGRVEPLLYCKNPFSINASFFLSVFSQLVLTSGGLGNVLGPKVTVPGLLSQGNCPGTKPLAKATVCMAVQWYLGSQATVQWDTRKPWGHGGDHCAMGGVWPLW